MSRRFPHILCPLLPTSDSGVACAVGKTEDPMPWDSDKSSNLYSATSYIIRSSNSKGVGSPGRQLLFSFSSFLINAKPLVKTFMIRQGNQTFSFELFLCIWLGCFGQFSFLCIFLSSSPFPPNILTVLSISIFPLSSYNISHCPYIMHSSGPHNQDLSHLKCQMYNVKEGKERELLKQQDWPCTGQAGVVKSITAKISSV